MSDGGSRREFLSAALIGLSRKSDRPVAGEFIDDAHLMGHLLRDRASFPAPKQQVKVPVVIVGGGMAGLSAAWRLEKHGYRDFVLLEMESRAGGNARWGENEITPYPWAAHYVPVPGKKVALVRELMEELGVLRNGIWDERQLCFSPQERLFLHGRWQEGIEPAVGATTKDREEFRRFEEKITELRASGDFTIPMETGARPNVLDQVSMAEWVQREGFVSPYLNWYINYACRDDYGAMARETSAWAGVHYFASREPDEKGPLTWPEGNGWIARHLIGKLEHYIRSSAVVHQIVRDGRRWRVRAADIEYTADVVIFAAPSFVASYICTDVAPMPGLAYSPWLTANLTLDRWPRERGLEVAWDNVIYDSPALGYVVATHQSLGSHMERTVWTYYWALAADAPAEGRKLLLAKEWSYWKTAILDDLSRAHPDIRECVSRIDILRMGHAMARPVVGFLESAERLRLTKGHNGFLFANSDVSGFSIFEEAQYRGVKAADGALRFLGRG